MLASALLWGGALLLFAATETVLWAAVAAALVGLGSALFMALNNGLIQTVVQPAMRGRVMSMVMLIWGAMPLGVLPLSLFAEAFGIAAALELSALGLVLAVLLAWRGLPALVTLGRSPSVASADTAN
jgi:MFS family permease